MTSQGDPLSLVKQYYDAFLYVANWGTHQLMLRLPRAILDQVTAVRYGVERGPFSVHATSEHIILAVSSHTEESEDWDEGEGWLATLVPLRADIASGDLRSLYLGWLLCVQEGQFEDDLVEPPVPPGLGELSAPLQALMEFLGMEEKLLDSAAERSREAMRFPPPVTEASQWLHTLADAEKNSLLLRLACGDVHLMGRGAPAHS